MSCVDVEDVAWLSSVIGQQVATCKLDDQDLSKISTLSSMRWLTLELADGGAMTVVLKATKPGIDRAVTFGLAREGLFYKLWRELSPSEESLPSQLGSVVPRVFFSAGDMASGSKTIMMEDLAACVQAGYFFGAANPNNWGRDLEASQKGFRLSAAEVTTLCFSAAAKLHAAYWNCEQLKGGGSTSWLKGSEWLSGTGRESWEATQAEAASMWAKLKESISAGSCAVRFDKPMVDLLDASVAKASWEAFQAELAARPCGFTLTHGDFHPANFLVRPKVAEGEHAVVLVDWEVVGAGSGPQDLGQFMISHADPATRSSLERGAVQAYFAELKSLNPSISMTHEECWAEYVAGGLGRWMWFVPLLVTMCTPAMGQFFVDQVQSFAAAHGVGPDTVPMPRA